MLRTILKTASIIGFGLVISVSSHATSRDGFYVGLGVGASYDKFDLTTKNNATGFTVRSASENATNVIGSAFLGYGNTAESGFYLGGELGTYLPKRSLTITNRPGVALTNLTFSDKLTVQDYVTFDVLPGFRLSENWLLYLRGGITYAHMTIYQPTQGAATSFSADNNRIGGRVGAGVNVGFTDNFGMSLDYFYTQYQDSSYTFPAFNTKFTQGVSSNYFGISASYTL